MPQIAPVGRFQRPAAAAVVVRFNFSPSPRKGSTKRWAGLAVFLASCQSYDFRHVSPTPVQVIMKKTPIGASPGTPYIMIVQDLSGSMCEPIQTGVALDGGYCANDRLNDSKIGLTAQSMNVALGQLDPLNDIFYLGLTAFPVDQGCGVPSTSVFPIDNAQTTLQKIAAWYTTAVDKVKGGTPTADTLTQAAQDPALLANISNAQKYIILITDGLPNCDRLNACVLDPANNHWSDDAGHGCESQVVQNALAAMTGQTPATPPPQCICSNGDCPVAPGMLVDGGLVDGGHFNGNVCCGLDPATFQPSDPNYATYQAEAAEQCLDGANVLKVARSLFAQHINLFVIGMGFDFSSAPGGLLDQIAQAGSGSPDAGYIHASDQASLNAAINGLIHRLVSNCVFALDSKVSDGRLIEVVLDSQTLTLSDPNGFSFDMSANAVTLLGTSCATVKDGNKHELDITALGAN